MRDLQMNLRRDGGQRNGEKYEVKIMKYEKFCHKRHKSGESEGTGARPETANSNKESEGESQRSEGRGRIGID